MTNTVFKTALTSIRRTRCHTPPLHSLVSRWIFSSFRVQQRKLQSLFLAASDHPLLVYHCCYYCYCCLE